MTKYSVSIWNNETWESIALFSDAADFDAMVDFCMRQFENGNSLSTPAENIAITDLTTGEIVWNWLDSVKEFYPEDDYVDESNYDPYLGCEVYETEPFCDMW